ncbi:hypothetical protein Q7P37_007219 [Cladosporium fusiforme]
MINGLSFLTLAHNPPSYEQFDLRKATLRRKSAHLWDCAPGAASGYPSPPMSSPPSPTRRPSDLTLPSTRSQQPVPASTVPPTISTTTYPSEETRAPTSTAGPANLSATTYQPPTSFTAGPFLEPLGSVLGFPSTSYAPPTSTAGRTGAQEGKKGKTHVASACVNCKRAHLSCDVQRPCARCVASGKQDTCYDVAHKKRGRPRLRDESQFALERTMPTTNMNTSPTTLMSTPSRPIAATRQRRAESFRSIQSITSEESSSYGPPTPGFFPRPPAPFQTPLTYPAPARQVFSTPIEPEVPTALLDLDFVIIRANMSFRQIMADNRDLTRSRLHEFAAPADAESFMSIRSRLRGEREAREPAFLPPIVSSGEDPLGGVSDAEVEKLTQGFSDQTYTWVQLKPGPRGSQTFPARVRLAKAATYFVVVTLPSFRPIEHPKPLMPAAPVGSPYSFGPPLLPAEEALKEQQRQGSTHSAPPSLVYPYEPTHGPAQHLRHRPRAPSRSYPQPQPQPQSQYPYPSQQPQSQFFLSSQPLSGYPQESRPTAASPHTQAPPYGPGPLPASLTGPSRDVQLPPIATSPALALASGPSSMPPVHGPSPATATTTVAQRSSDSDEDSEGRKLRSPRKRRRMGIDEVLQK